MEVKCFVCGKETNKSPSKIFKRPCCSRKCQVTLASKDILKIGESSQYKKGHRTPQVHYQKLAKLLKNDGHPKWKGEQVSYRGLHQWIRRNKGHGNRCSMCGFASNKPRMIQWANVDGRYRRRLEDYIALCVSCHKNRDLKLKSTQGAHVASR